MSSVTPASQPGSSGPFDSTWLNKVATLLRDLIIANVALALGNISVLGVTPFAFLTQWGHDLQQKASDAYTGQQTANDKADGAATVLGLGSGTGAGSAFLGTLNLSSIWSNIASTLLNPLGFFANLVSGFLPNSQLGGHDASKVTSGTFADGFLPGLGSLRNAVFDGSSNTTGSTGKSLADVLTALQTQFGTITGAASNSSSAIAGLGTVQTDLAAIVPSAITALTKAVESINILNFRANKAPSQGANPTSLASFTAGHFSSGGSVVTSSLTAGTAIGQRFTVPESATYGFLEILASGSSVTNIFVNIFKIDPATNAKTALFNSSNLAASIPTSLSDHTRILLPGMAATVPGDELLLEIVNGGSNALTVATKATGLPNNSHETIQNVAFSRSTSAGGNSPTSLTSGQGAYSATVPYAVIGIANVPAGYHPPDSETFTSSTTFAVPAWMASGDIIDYGAIGGGGGGGSSFFYVGGNGGQAAAWVSGRLIYGTDVKIGSSLTIVVGARGLTGGSSSSGGTGGSTTLTYTDPSNTPHTIAATGGSGGAYGGGGSGGQGASDLTLDGITHYGGAAVGQGSTGQNPGGGGGGAIPYLNGTSGGAGELDLYLQQH